MNTYITEFTGKCPNNKKIVDNYKIKISSKSFIMVEDLKAYLKSFKNKAVYQEDLTKKIAKRFPKCKVCLIGDHLGVTIKSIAKYD